MSVEQLKQFESAEKRRCRERAVQLRTAASLLASEIQDCDAALQGATAPADRIRLLDERVVAEARHQVLLEEAERWDAAAEETHIPYRLAS